MIAETKLCKACNRELGIRDFYYSNSLPEGRLNDCKDCISKKINIYDPLTFIPILQIVDVPYIQDKWTTYIVNILARNQELTVKLVLGKYLACMKLPGYKYFRYKDSDMLNAQACEEKALVCKKQREECKKDRESLL